MTGAGSSSESATDTFGFGRYGPEEACDCDCDSSVVVSSLVPGGRIGDEEVGSAMKGRPGESSAPTVVCLSWSNLGGRCDSETGEGRRA